MSFVATLIAHSSKCGTNLVDGLLGILQVRVVTDAGK